VVLLAAAAPAAADWLVTRDGGRVETKGAWQVKGKLVVFTRADGTLASLRLGDVDLAASDAATQDAKKAKDQAPAAEPAPPRKKSVRSLTDADFSRKPGSEPAEGAAPQDAGTPAKDAAPPDAQKAGSPVAVSTWSKTDRAEGDGIDLFGTLQNSSANLVADVVLKVKLLDENNTVVGSGEGVLAASSIPAGGTTSFRVPFSGVFTFVKAEFSLTSRSILPAPDPAKQAPPPGTDHR